MNSAPFCMHVWWLVPQAEVRDKMCVYVCELDYKETLAGKLISEVFGSGVV